MKDMEEVSARIDAHIWKNMRNVLGAVRQGIRRMERQAVESPEPSDSSSSSGYDSASTSPTDSPPMVITPDPGSIRNESPEPIELRATPSPSIVENAERRAESPRESTSEDRVPLPIDCSPFEEEEDDIFEVLANYAERKNRNFELLSRYLPGLLSRRDRTGEAVDSGEGQGKGTSSKEDPPPAEETVDSGDGQGEGTSSKEDPPPAEETVDSGEGQGEGTSSKEDPTPTDATVDSGEGQGEGTSNKEDSPPAEETVDSGEGQGEGTSSKEDPPPAEVTVDSEEGQGEGTSNKEDPPPAEKSTDLVSREVQSTSTSSQPDEPSSSGNPLRHTLPPPPVSHPIGLPPRPPRLASSQSRLNAQRHRSSSPSGRGQARSLSAGSRSRNPHQPIGPRSISPEILLTASDSRVSRTSRSSGPRPSTSMTTLRNIAEDEEEDEEIDNYRSPGALIVGPSSAPSLQIQQLDPERDLISFDEEIPDTARSRNSESEYETANENTARSSDCDTARTVFTREEFERTKAGKTLEDFLAKNNKPRDDDDDDESSYKTARETQPSDQDPTTN